MPDVIDDERHAAICDSLMSGLSVRAVARQFGTQEREILAVWDEEARRCFDGEELRKHVALEVRRVRAASLKYFRKGMELVDGELATGIYFKGVERLMYMLGANQPQQYAVHLMNQAAPEQTSTEFYEAALDQVLGVGPRERLLENKETHREDMTLEEVTELEALRREREDRQDAERQRNRRERAERLAARRGNGGAVD
jgi:hypothetical protein